MAQPERWLRGPVEGIVPLLQPVAHALLQARDDIKTAAQGLTTEQLWARPGGAASVGFHLRHLAGSLDRLFAYARGESLTPEQLAYLKSEAVPGEPPADAESLIAGAERAIDAGLRQVKDTAESALLEERRVGRQGLKSTTLGLLFHGAEHTTRHAGQIITTARIVSAA